MQGGVFKKSKQPWLQELFSGLSRSPVLCRPIENTLRSWKNDIVRFDVKGQERIIHPPDISFKLDPKLALKLRERLQRTRKTLQGIIVADSAEGVMTSFMELRSPEEDVGAVQETDGVFCVGVAMSKGDGDADLQRRVKEELRRCTERSGAIFSQNSHNSSLSELAKATIRQMRTFLLIDQSKDGLILGKLLYFPRASIPIKKLHNLHPTSLTANDVRSHIKKTLNFEKEVRFGYVSLDVDSATNKTRFILLDKNDPDLLSNAHPVLGVWAAGALGTGIARDGAIWTVIMEYLTDPHLTMRLSVTGQRSGLFFAFDNPSARDQLIPYVFEFPQNARWSISSRVEHIGKIPEKYTFSQQEVIMEQEREQSQVESIVSKQDKGRGGYQEAGSVGGGSAGGDSMASNRILQQKDAEIRRLKVQVQFYRNQCQKLQQAVNTMNALQIAQKSIINQQNLISQQSLISQIPYSPFRSTILSPQEESLNQDEPFFGKRSEYQLQHQQSKVKEFTVRDTKNISFAQEQSFEEELPSSNIVQSKYLKFNTPQFREVKERDREREVKGVRPQDVRKFNFGKNDSAEEIEIQSKIRQEPKERQKQKQTYKIQQNDRTYGMTNLKNYEEKYGPKKEDPLPIRKPTFPQEPRSQRIKNELYSSEKDPKRQAEPSSPLPTKNKNSAQIKSPQKREDRSKSPILRQSQKKKKNSSEDEDAEVETIVAKWRKFK